MYHVEVSFEVDPCLEVLCLTVPFTKFKGKISSLMQNNISDVNFLVLGDVLLFFTWPPDSAVSTNYEVVLFQPWPGNAVILGSVYNITSYLNLPHHSTVYWIVYLDPQCTDPPPHPPSIE